MSAVEPPYEWIYPGCEHTGLQHAEHVEARGLGGGGSVCMRERERGRETKDDRNHKTHIHIITPTRRLVVIRPRVHKQRVLRPRRRCRHVAARGADVKGRQVAAGDVRVRPRHRVAREGEVAVRVGRGAEPRRQRALRLVRGVLDLHVQQAAASSVVDELPVDDVELARRGGVGHHGVGRGGGAGGRRRGGGGGGLLRLEVAVVVGRLDGADPVPPRDERGRGAGAGAGCCCCRGGGGDGGEGRSGGGGGGGRGRRRRGAAAAAARQGGGAAARGCRRGRGTGDALVVVGVVGRAEIPRAAGRRSGVATASTWVRVVSLRSVHEPSAPRGRAQVPTLPVCTGRARALGRRARGEQAPGQALPGLEFTHRWSGGGSI